MYEQVKYSCLGLTLDSNNSNGNNNNSGGNNANSSTSPSKRNLKHLLPIHPKFAKSLTKLVPPTATILLLLNNIKLAMLPVLTAIL